MLKVAVLVSGGGTTLQALINQIHDGGVTGTEITAVISSKRHAFALKRAAEAGIETACVAPKDYGSREKFEQALLEKLKSCNADLLVLAGYLIILPPAIVRAFPMKMINVHPSLIPSFCGKHFYGKKVFDEVMHRGVKLTGATVHFVDEGANTGPIILQKAIEVRESDTPESLQKRVMEKAQWVILPKAVDLIAHNQVSVINGRVHIEN